jgi:hypothetical protein
MVRQRGSADPQRVSRERTFVKIWHQRAPADPTNPSTAELHLRRYCPAKPKRDIRPVSAVRSPSPTARPSMWCPRTSRHPIRTAWTSAKSPSCPGNAGTKRARCQLRQGHEYNAFEKIVLAGTHPLRRSSRGTSGEERSPRTTSRSPRWAAQFFSWTMWSPGTGHIDARRHLRMESATKLNGSAQHATVRKRSGARALPAVEHHGWSLSSRTAHLSTRATRHEHHA